MRFCEVISRIVLLNFEPLLLQKYFYNFVINLYGLETFLNVDSESGFKCVIM